jgi:hypothetical protein
VPCFLAGIFTFIYIPAPWHHAPLIFVGGFLKSIMGSSISWTRKRAWSANFKMVWYVLLRPLRPEQNRPARRTGPTDPTIGTTQYFCKNQDKLEKRFQKTTKGDHSPLGKWFGCRHFQLCFFPVSFVCLQKYCVVPIDGANDAF